MSDNSVVNIKNGIIASVIAGVILMLISPVKSYVWDFLQWISSGILWLWGALWAKHAFPGWMLVIVACLALVGIITLIISLHKVFTKKDFHSFTEGRLYGAVWRWKWASDRISNLWCFCPRCDATLVYDDSSCRNLMENTNRTDFICENCGNSVIASITGGRMAYALGVVEREIYRKIRTGEFKGH